MALSAIIVTSSFSFSQDIRIVKNRVANKAGSQMAMPATYSPNLHHEHDGEHCVSDAFTEDWIQQMGIEEQYRAEEENDRLMASHMSSDDRATYTIPVIFHVVHNTDNPAENVSEADLNTLINAVNLDFSMMNADIGNARTGAPYNFVPANADIEFCMAKRDPWGNPLAEYGINRVQTTEDYYDPDTEGNKMKSSTGGGTGIEGWDRNSYVNIWVCDITNGVGFGTAGYAYKPTVSSLPPADIDGIVIDYDIGVPPTNRVLTHEIGHYLGLSHTWGNSNDATSCTDDDGLTDTPFTAGPSQDLPGSCSGSQQTCSGVETQYENYMDYSNCTVMFTNEQANLMQMVLQDSRLPLTLSDGCLAINPVPPTADFSADITTVIEGGAVNFTDLSTDYPTGWSWVVSGSGTSFIGGTTNASQDPTIQFTIAGTYTVTLTASNGEGSDDEIKTNYITVVASGGGAVACDTSRNYINSELANMTAYGITGEAGYYPSLATLNTGALTMDMYAEPFNTATPTEVRRIYLPIFQVDDIGGASNVTFTVWNDGAGQPGTIVGTEVVPLSDLNAGFWNIIDFSTPVAVNGNYWVGMQMDYTSGFDTVMFATTNFTDRPAGPSSTQIFIGGVPGWYPTSDIFGSTPDCSIIMDVLTSNGPTPTSSVSFPTTETCEGMEVTMNGYGSLNADSYYWNLDDGTSQYFYTEPNLTTTFTAATWTINLEVEGSCQTAVSPDYVLVVNPALNGTYTVQNENCVAADGEIDFTISGGDGGPYNYSINSGATVETTNTYTGLVTGDYDYIITDNANCELIGTVNVGNDNTFAPTITPSQTIVSGTSTDLTVTGGVSWTWYEGIIEIGTTQTITVAPTVTTTYLCNVVDASGCEAVLEVTLTMDPSGIGELNLENSFSVYPNPTTGEFSLLFDLNESIDLGVEIVNVVGEQVFVDSYSDVKNQSVNLDLSTVAEGVYFVVLTSGEESVTKKIIVRR